MKFQRNSNFVSIQKRMIVSRIRSLYRKHFRKNTKGSENLQKNEKLNQKPIVKKSTQITKCLRFTSVAERSKVQV